MLCEGALPGPSHRQGLTSSHDHYSAPQRRHTFGQTPWKAIT
jgi:hypothetical protein